MKKDKKIGISFSGGVARGIGHIGVVKALEELNVEFDAVSGTSAGAIVAVFYAAGFTSDEMLAIIKGSSILNFIRPSLNLSGLGDLTFLKKIIRENIKVKEIESLPKPVYIAITNLSEGKIEYVNQGPIDLNVMASCSIPLLLKPTKINDKIYVDGGLLDNLPIKPLTKVCDRIIGVNVNPHHFETNPANVLTVSQRIFDVIVWRNVLSHTDECDYLLDLDEVSKNYSIYDYRKADKMVETAYLQTIKNRDKILEIFNKSTMG